MFRLARRAWAELPRGESLPREVWHRRHRAIIAILWVHAVGVAGFALAVGNSVAHSVSEGGILPVAHCWPL